MQTDISAHVQTCNLHMLPVIAANSAAYTRGMSKKVEQGNSAEKADVIKAVAAWMKATCRSSGISASRLAVMAGSSDSTGTRALNGNGTATPKLETLHGIALAAGVPSIVDFLLAEAKGAPRPWVPRVETIASLLAVAMRVDEADLERQAELLEYASAVHTGLEWLAEDPANEDDPGFLRGVRKRVAEALSAVRALSSKAS